MDQQSLCLFFFHRVYVSLKSNMEVGNYVNVYYIYSTSLTIILRQDDYKHQSDYFIKKNTKSELHTSTCENVCY